MSQRPAPARLALLALVPLSLSAWLAQGCSKEEIKADLTPKLGVLELSSTHRTGDPEPSGAARIEITPSELLVEGESVMKLENGKIPQAERAGYDLPKLKEKLAGKPGLAIGVYAAVPYATLARVMHTGIGAGAAQLSFKVRKPNTSKETGWLTVKQNRFIQSADQSQFDKSQLVPWDSFAKVWDESLEACQTSTGGDCGYKPMAKAQGGELDLMLRVRGSGYAVRFRQAGVAAPTADAGVPGAPAEAAGGKPVAKKSKGKKRKSELLDGVQAGPAAAEEAPPEPSTEHVFTLRTETATLDPSPISGIVKPVCGAVRCPIVLDAEGISMSSQVLALLGAAFPDGTEAPSVAWVLPPKDG